MQRAAGRREKQTTAWLSMIATVQFSIKVTSASVKLAHVLRGPRAKGITKKEIARSIGAQTLKY